MTPDQRGNDLVIDDGDAGVSGRGPTRRRALVLAGGTAAALGAAIGPFSHLFTSAAAEGGPPEEIVLAGWLVGLELAALDLYEVAEGVAAGDERTATLATTCGGNHDAQSKALGAMITATGATAPSSPDAGLVAEFKPRIQAASGTAALASVLTDLENGFAATYQASLATLSSAPLASVAAQILATDAAQSVAWAAAAAGPGSAMPLPPPDAIPASQTTQGQFEQPAPTSTTSTTTGGAS